MLERKDNNGNYCIENCCWATRHQQLRNKRNNRYYEFQNRRMVMSDWAKELGISKGTLRMRLVILGWPPEKAFTVPAVPYQKAKAKF